MLNVWGTLLYQVIGGLFFFTLAMIAIVKTKAADLSLQQDRKWFMWLILGAIFVSTGFTVWTLVAIYT